MPVPMIAPMPSAVRSQAVRVLFQTMIRMICVCEDLFNGLGSKESADHRTSSSRGGSERHWRVSKLLFHMGLSIAGLLHGIAERDGRDALIWFIRSVLFI